MKLTIFATRLGLQGCARIRIGSGQKVIPRGRGGGHKPRGLPLLHQMLRANGG
jgi:hypothetical protein